MGEIELTRDAVPAPFERQRLGHADDAEFRGAIGDMAVDGDRAGLAGEIDDACRRGRPRSSPRPTAWAIRKLPVRLIVDGRSQAASAKILGGSEIGDAGAVHQDVDAAEAARHGGHGGSMLAGSVTLQAKAAASPAATSARCGGGGFEFMSRRATRAPLAANASVDRRADAGGGAGDDGDLAGQ